MFTEFIYFFQRYHITTIQMQISIKICDQPVCLTTSADEPAQFWASLPVAQNCVAYVRKHYLRHNAYVP